MPDSNLEWRSSTEVVSRLAELKENLEMLQHQISVVVGLIRDENTVTAGDDFGRILGKTGPSCSDESRGDEVYGASSTRKDRRDTNGERSEEHGG
jgi:hypothetical protein